jgi:hypothetical protein
MNYFGIHLRHEVTLFSCKALIYTENEQFQIFFSHASEMCDALSNKRHFRKYYNVHMS